MRIGKQIALAALCAAALTIFGGCANNSANSSINTGIPDYDDSTPTDAYDVPNTPSNDTSTPQLTYLGNCDLENSAALSAYRKTNAANYSGQLITVERVSDSEYESKLASLIYSDNSPDLTDKRENSFPYLMSINMYEDLTPYIDIGAPQWSEYADYIAHYEFNGIRYFYPSSITPVPELLVYDKMKFVQYGLADPEMLWKKDEWTWEALSRSSAALSENIDTDFSVYGENVADNILASTGQSVVTKDDGKLIYLDDGNLGRVKTFFTENKISQGLSAAMFLEDPLAVFVSAPERTIGELRSHGVNIGIVPYPRDEEANAYYCKAVSTGFLVPKGAKNIKGAASFINCARIADADSGKEDLKADQEQGLLRSDSEWINSIRTDDRMQLVLTDTLCLNAESNAIVSDYFSSFDSLSEGAETDGSGLIDIDIQAVKTKY